MDPSGATDLVRQAVMLVVILAGPVLGVGLVVGLTVSLVQAMTQVHEQTLSLVPRIVAMLLSLVVLGPWMIDRMVEFGREMFAAAP